MRWTEARYDGSRETDTAGGGTVEATLSSWSLYSSSEAE
jgi:hypothetical protein